MIKGEIGEREALCLEQRQVVKIDTNSTKRHFSVRYFPLSKNFSNK